MTLQQFVSSETVVMRAFEQYFSARMKAMTEQERSAWENASLWDWVDQYELFVSKA